MKSSKKARRYAAVKSARRSAFKQQTNLDKAKFVADSRLTDDKELQNFRLKANTDTEYEVCEISQSQLDQFISNLEAGEYSNKSLDELFNIMSNS